MTWWQVLAATFAITGLWIGTCEITHWRHSR